MFTRKILTAALVALTLAGAAVGSTGSAQAGPWHGSHGGHGFHGGHGGRGFGWGVGGLATGLVIGSVLASRSTYAEPVRSCTYVERLNAYGEVIGTRKICRVVEE